MKTLERKILSKRKRKNVYYLGAALIFLIFFAYSQQGSAMDEDPGEQQLSYEKSGIAKVRTQEKEAPLPPYQFSTLKDIDGLIIAAKENKVEAQDQLITLCSKRRHWHFLPPTKIGFLNWKAQDLDQEIQGRCMHHDSYALYVLVYFQELGEKFPGLIEQIKTRARQGNSYAQFNLGYMYAGGVGIAKNETEACRLYKLSANQNNELAQLHLGLMYGEGRGVEKDWEEGFNYFTLAAKQGNCDALLFLGRLYEYGSGVTENLRETLRYYKLAADQGHVEAQKWAGFISLYGYGSLTPNLKEGIYYYKLAADQGDTEAQRKIAKIYEEGTGTEQNLKKAFYYLELAADQGDIGAQNELAYRF